MKITLPKCIRALPKYFHFNFMIPLIIGDLKIIGAKFFLNNQANLFNTRAKTQKLTLKFVNRNFEFLIPDAPELVANFLEGEQDMSCKRNAFLMLLHADQERALAYLASCLDQVNSFGDILQLVIVELIYKVSRYNRRYCVTNMGNSLQVVGFSYLAQDKSLLLKLVVCSKK